MFTAITLRAMPTGALNNGTLRSNHTHPDRLVTANLSANGGQNSDASHSVRNLFIYIIIAIAIFILAAAIGFTCRHIRRPRARPSKV